eukprot:TRINITY_DN5635_c0_g2_i6.p1 TRINITY_DN5635_c0_g2~~TRINITY_DN5635_c0_g2_i6.p1  ORF type:complete len:194 (-),score=38.17 TRINITY_DN5635_c0_g2_i6:185-766(-)
MAREVNTEYESAKTRESEGTSAEHLEFMPSTKAINPSLSRFPYCIVWTPIPLLTWLIPWIGHMGIATSRGVIHDFAGSYFISVDDFAFGSTHKYYQLDISDEQRAEYDRAIREADDNYREQAHNLCCNNCHSHVADVLERLNYKNGKSFNMVSVWWMLTSKGKYVSCKYAVLTYLPSCAILGFIVAMVLLAGK